MEQCESPEDESMTDCKQDSVCACPTEDDQIRILADSQFEDEKLIGVLSEDHPLLQKFQQSLKAHLLKVQAQLLDEISDLDYGIKQKEKEREEAGANLYDMQQEICRQNTLLEDYSRQIREINEKRTSHEKGVGISRKEFEDKMALNKEAKRLHNERLIELNNLQILENNMDKWAKEIEEEVTTAKRVVSKDSKDQEAATLEKKKMDLLIFNMDAEVRKKEQELESITAGYEEQRGVLEVLRNNFSDANADLEALEQEQKRLTQAWGEVIIAIQNRDRVLYSAKGNLNAFKEKHKVLLANIDGSKKEAAKEMEKNEKLELFKNRMIEDGKNVKRQLDKEDDTLRKIEEKLNQIDLITQETENDFQLAKQEGNALEVQMRAIQYKFDKQASKKLKEEEKILKLMQDQITADKASQYRMKLLREVQQNRRTLEGTLSVTENQLSSVLLELEMWKGTIIELKKTNDEASKLLKEVEAQAADIYNEMKNAERINCMKMKQVEQLSKKLDNLLNTTGSEEFSPTELKIKELERQVQETETQIRNLQRFWLTLQGHLVNLTEKRTAQLNELKIARKQVLIIRQKTLKTDLELEDVTNQGQELQRNIKKLETTLELLGGKLFQKKKNQEVDEQQCNYIHFAQMEKLKDKEMDVLYLEQEIVELNKEIEQLKEVVLERHREALSWETKYKMTEDIIRWQRNEKGNESEIAAMKTEIRRMEVRYNHLKRAQEKLVQDLEHCVMHRENIFVTAMTRQKMEGKETKSRSNVQHKLNEIKNKLKMIHNEIGSTEKALADVNSKYEALVQDICKKESDIENEKMQDKLIQAEIEEGFLMKHRNLESIVRKQHRAKRYRSLACCKTLPKTKTDATVVKDICKQCEINDNLTDIGQHLLNEFPEKKYFIMRIMQTLRED